VETNKLMRPTFATVSLEAIASNYQLASRLAPASKSIAVIKANAYGHGMVKVAQHLQKMVPAFAVAFIDEAIQLRDAGISKPILVLQGVHRAADLAEVVARDLWLMLNQQQQLEWLLSARLVAPVRTWLKLDTGMHHLGISPERLDRACEDLGSSVNVQPGLVLCTHLSCADDLEDPMTRQQVGLIHSAAAKYSFELSIANSAAILHWPEAHAGWNRPGYMLYGSCPTGSFDNDVQGLQPAMSMQSEIIAIRDLKPGDGVGYGLDWIASKPSKIGTIAIGYGDGYPRHAPSGTPVLVNGRRVPLVGRVSMDAISVDLSGLDDVKVGDAVELWGGNITVNELASAAATIGYEILAGLTGRVPLHY
jgi:alanine racemase